MKKIKAILLMFISLSIVWLILTSFTDKIEIYVGLIIAFVLSVFIGPINPIFAEISVHPKAIFYSIVYFFVFIIELVKSNLDVAFRVINPKLPINPGIVKVKTRLKSKIGRTILANSITLTPGTLTVEVHDEFFYIHWINITDNNIDNATREIVSKFEKYLEVIFG